MRARGQAPLRPFSLRYRKGLSFDNPFWYRKELAGGGVHIDGVRHAVLPYGGPRNWGWWRV
jgi:hypothetical protein